MIASGDIIKTAMETSAKGQKNLQQAVKRKRRRKFILIGILATYALMGWLRLRGALLYRDYFDSINLQPSPSYLAISGGVIGFLLSLAIILHVLKTRIGSRFSRWLAGIFLVWFWIDRIWLSTREAFYNQLEVSLLITAATLFWALILIRKKDWTLTISTTEIQNLISPLLKPEMPDQKIIPSEKDHVEQA